MDDCAGINYLQCISNGCHYFSYFWVPLTSHFSMMILQWYHWTLSILVQVTACSLSAPSHYVNQCRLQEQTSVKLQSKYTNIYSQKSAFGYVICKIVADIVLISNIHTISCWHQCCLFLADIYESSSFMDAVMQTPSSTIVRKRRRLSSGNNNNKPTSPTSPTSPPSKQPAVPSVSQPFSGWDHHNPDK